MDKDVIRVTEMDDGYEAAVFKARADVIATGEPVTVPLTIYIGEERKVIGEATLTGDEIIATVTPQRDHILRDLVDDGLVQSVQITFNAPPAIPVFRDGTVRWVRNH